MTTPVNSSSVGGSYLRTAPWVVPLLAVAATNAAAIVAFEVGGGEPGGGEEVREERGRREEGRERGRVQGMEGRKGKNNDRERESQTDR